MGDEVRGARFSQNANSIHAENVLVHSRKHTLCLTDSISLMLVSRACTLRSSQLVWSCFTANPLICRQHSWSSTLVNAPRRLSSSSWNDFASATGIPLQNEKSSEVVYQPVAALSSVTALSQKQKKVIAFVERAVHSALAQTVAPSHLTRYFAFLNLSVLTISRDCYVVNIGWDCSAGEFSNVAQQHMQVRWLGTPCHFIFSNPVLIFAGFFDQTDSSISQFNHEGRLPPHTRPPQLPSLSLILFH